MKRFTHINRSRKTPPVADHPASHDCLSHPYRRITKRSAAITTLTAGPAIATRSSWSGFSGNALKRATPPIGSRMMSRRFYSETLCGETVPEFGSTTQANSAQNECQRR